MAASGLRGAPGADTQAALAVRDRRIEPTGRMRDFRLRRPGGEGDGEGGGRESAEFLMHEWEVQEAHATYQSATDLGPAILGFGSVVVLLALTLAVTLGFGLGLVVLGGGVVVGWLALRSLRVGLIARRRLQQLERESLALDEHSAAGSQDRRQGMTDVHWLRREMMRKASRDAFPLRDVVGALDVSHPEADPEWKRALARKVAGSLISRGHLRLLRSGPDGPRQGEPVSGREAKALLKTPSSWASETLSLRATTDGQAALERGDFGSLPHDA